MIKIEKINQVSTENRQIVADVRGCEKQRAVGHPYAPDAPPSNKLLLHTTRSSMRCGLSGRCINGVYQVAGNLFQLGAFLGATLLTVADLSDRHKDAVGGLTVGCITLGTFCYWQLACCPHQTEDAIPDKSYSAFAEASTDNPLSESDVEPGEK